MALPGDQSLSQNRCAIFKHGYDYRITFDVAIYSVFTEWHDASTVPCSPLAWAVCTFKEHKAYKIGVHAACVTNFPTNRHSVKVIQAEYDSRSVVLRFCVVAALFGGQFGPRALLNRL